MTNSLAVFSRRVFDEWLPDFCAVTGLDAAGFPGVPADLAEDEVSGFLRAVDMSVVERRPSARFILPQSRASIALFWEGNKATSPRQIKFARETLLSCSAAASLHLDHGWPVPLLGVESKDRAFDVVAVRPSDQLRAWIGVEVKTSLRLLERLLAEMGQCIALGRHEQDRCQVAGHRKYAGLAASGAPVFWAIAPGWSPVFSVRY